MANRHQLLGVLSAHIGRERGISVRQLALELDVDERAVRTLVSELRTDGVAVCGTPGDGYFIASTPEELEHTLNFLRSRAMHSLVLESRLRKISLLDLIGQLRLPT
jgi:biotin operon repressor